MTYFNGTYMAFIACVIRPGKTGIICKIHFIDGCINSHTYNLPFHTQKVAIYISRSAYLDGGI